jgi:hypothetical protein
MVRRRGIRILVFVDRVEASKVKNFFFQENGRE